MLCTAQQWKIMTTRMANGAQDQSFLNWNLSKSKIFFPTVHPRQQHASPPPEPPLSHISRANGKESLRMAQATTATGVSRGYFPFRHLRKTKLSQPPENKKAQLFS
jgi:hypothetical protein